eukprot:TRINITY_DN5429_c0_g1_i30.p2 TRINITY_DN5429_c0_g1~~TRINITY_DN5429_c0_g1_i30.p2  ORF type:complete len:130 (-),score=52.23 TRINITY_DN5429_c0_g1_i30:97-486(-)
MLFYIIVLKPFTGNFLNRINFINELIILLSFSSILFINVKDVSDSFISITGWILVGGVIVSLIIAWCTTILPMVKAFLGKSKRGAKDSEKKSPDVAKKELKMSRTTEEQMMKKVDWFSKSFTAERKDST